MNRHILLLSFLAILSPIPVSATETLAAHPWDGSLAPPVHRFVLFDELGDAILPQYAGSLPVSTRNSCGTCHSYTTVSKGWHWNSSKGTARPGRSGEPWVLLDDKTGTQIPMSYRDWKGTWRPEAVGVSAWDFTRTFGHHLPGGDMGEPDDATSDSEARWDLSGKLEINCLGCHSPSPQQDASEWARQIGRENFRWAATAASGIGDVDGMASRMRESWRLVDGPNPDDKEFAVAPSVQYDQKRFDSKQRTVVEVTRTPPDKNCLQCHSVTPASQERWQVDGDVHSRAGMKCVACHRNDLSHDIVRGYESEAGAKHDPSRADFSCRGCHMNASSSQHAGRLGAPNPKHGGLPPVHFDKLSCTACHSGPLPSSEPVQVRTSRANRLGVYGRAVWATDAPYIAEPVFMKDERGQIAPFRIMWPAFWARVEGERLTPLRPEKVAEAGKGILDGEERVLAILSVLAMDAQSGEIPVLVTRGKVYSRGADDRLQREDYAGTRTIASAFWGKRCDGEYVPMIADFDTSSPLDMNLEQRLKALLEGLAGVADGQTPALAAGGRLFYQDADGTVTVSETTIKSPEYIWVKLAGTEPQPLVSETLVDALEATVGREQPLTEIQVVRVLKALAEQTSDTRGMEYAYVAMGRMYRAGSDGKLVASAHESAEPVSWPVGHDVRPAGQSLGANSCTECHSRDAAFFFGQVTARGPLQTKAVAARPMHEFEKVDAGLERLFSDSFSMRLTLKVLLFVTSGLLAVILIPVTFLGMRRFARQLGPKE